MKTSVCKLYLTGSNSNLSAFGMSKENCFIYDQLQDEVIKLVVLQIEFFTAKNSSMLTVCFTNSDIAYTCMDKSKHQHKIPTMDTQTNAEISIAEVNIVKNRHTRFVKCISADYNSWIKDNMIDNMGCTPPFWDGFTDKKCTVQDLERLGKNVLISKLTIKELSNTNNLLRSNVFLC